MQIDRGYISLYIVPNPDRIEAVLAKLGDERHCPGSARVGSDWQTLSARHCQRRGRRSTDRPGAEQVAWYAHLPGSEGPGSGDCRKVVLQNMALLTGATVITGKMGRKLGSTTVKDLGCADRAKDGLVLIPDRMPHGLRIPFLCSQPVPEGQKVWSRNRPLWQHSPIISCQWELLWPSP